MLKTKFSTYFLTSVLLLSSAVTGHAFTCALPEVTDAQVFRTAYFDIECVNDNNATFTRFDLHPNPLPPAGEPAPPASFVIVDTDCPIGQPINPNDVCTLKAAFSTELYGRYTYDFNLVYRGEQHPGNLCDNNPNNDGCLVIGTRPRLLVVGDVGPPPPPFSEKNQTSAKAPLNHTVNVYDFVPNTSGFFPTKFNKLTTNIDTPFYLYVDSAFALWVSDFGNIIFQGFNDYVLRGNQNPFLTENIFVGNPTGIGRDSMGNTYVAVSDRINVYDSLNVFSYSIFGDVSGPGDITNPRGIWVAPNGKLYVANRDNSNILVFAPGASGNDDPIQIISSTGGLFDLDCPTGIWVDEDNNIWVADNCESVIFKFDGDANGDVEPLAIIKSPGFLSEPNSISVDPAGYVYVADPIAEAVLVFAPNAANEDGDPVDPVQIIGDFDNNAGGFGFFPAGLFIK